HPHRSQGLGEDLINDVGFFDDAAQANGGHDQQEQGTNVNAGVGCGVGDHSGEGADPVLLRLEQALIEQDAGQHDRQDDRGIVLVDVHAQNQLEAEEDRDHGHQVRKQLLEGGHGFAPGGAWTGSADQAGGLVLGQYQNAENGCRQQIDVQTPAIELVGGDLFVEGCNDDDKQAGVQDDTQAAGHGCRGQRQGAMGSGPAHFVINHTPHRQDEDTGGAGKGGRP